MSKDKIKVDKIVDARGSFCPGPLMELIRAIKKAKVGEVIAVYSTESGSKTDIPIWVEEAGHELIDVIEHKDYTEFIVRKKR